VSAWGAAQAIGGAVPARARSRPLIINQDGAATLAAALNGQGNVDKYSYFMIVTVRRPAWPAGITNGGALAARFLADLISRCLCVGAHRTRPFRRPWSSSSLPAAAVMVRLSDAPNRRTRASWLAPN
jgi:hypothetical protein